MCERVVPPSDEGFQQALDGSLRSSRGNVVAAVAVHRVSVGEPFMDPGQLTPFELHGMQPVLAVPDVDEAVAFYRDKLGFHVDFVAGDPPAHARVCADPTYSSPTVHIRFEPLPQGAPVNPSVYLWLHVGNGLDELFALYRDRGVEIVEVPSDRPWGLRQFTIRDCNGYVATFCGEIAASTRRPSVGSRDGVA